MSGGILEGPEGFTLGGEHGATLGNAVNTGVPYWAKVALEILERLPNRLPPESGKIVHKMGKMSVQEFTDFLAHLSDSYVQAILWVTKL